MEKVHVLYSVGPDPQARFWRTATATRVGKTWTARLPILSVKQPLFAFANIHYRLPAPEPVPFSRPTETFAISSLMHTAAPAELSQRGVSATDKRSQRIDDFSRGFEDWYLLSADNPHHWQFWTRKITDPKWQGKVDERLTFEVKTEKANKLVVIITENFFLGYRGPQRDLVAVVDLAAGNEWQRVQLASDRFQTVDGKQRLASWEQADLLGWRAYYEDRQGKMLGSKRWAGSRPEFRNLHWSRPGQDD